MLIMKVGIAMNNIVILVGGMSLDAVIIACPAISLNGTAANISSSLRSA